MKPRIYIETSVISYLTSRPSADAIVLARQQRTHELWSLLGVTCEPFISSLVTEEISRGDVNAAARRIEACRDCASFTVTDAARSIAKRLIDSGAIPATEPEDALHIGIAHAASVDYIASWNFAHLVGPNAKLKLQLRLAALGLAPIPIATPDEILEEFAL